MIWRLAGSFFPILILVFSGCDSYQKVLKSTDQELKLAKAKEYFQRERYDRAMPLFEELIQVRKGQSDISELYYYYAHCYYGLNDYLIAGFHFKQIATNYFSSPYAEECLYMAAYCNYQLSPVSSLDQTYTLLAIESFQLFINTYPASSRVPQCNALMDELWLKLQKKALDSAMLYFKIGQYEAAAVSFASLLNDYPDTPDAEEASFMILKSYYLLAANSIESRQRERYQKAIEAYEVFASKYAQSYRMREAETMYTSSVYHLNHLID
jgi:outer membrane protein assembly factor BamD